MHSSSVRCLSLAPVRYIQPHRFEQERRQRSLIDPFTLVNVDRTNGGALQALVEELLGVLHLVPLGEHQPDGVFEGISD